MWSNGRRVAVLITSLFPRRVAFAPREVDSDDRRAHDRRPSSTIAAASPAAHVSAISIGFPSDDVWTITCVYSWGAGKFADWTRDGLRGELVESVRGALGETRECGARPPWRRRRIGRFGAQLRALQSVRDRGSPASKTDGRCADGAAIARRGCRDASRSRRPSGGLRGARP